MRKALAQNPNMLRALLTFSFTLILLLAYIVYGATLDSGAWVYRTEMTETSQDTADGSLVLVANGSDGETSWWAWEVTTRTTNLSWVNVTVTDGPVRGEVSLLNAGATFWSHPSLGVEDVDAFNCKDDDRGAAEACIERENHTMALDSSGAARLLGLASLKQPLSGEGSVFAEDEAEATGTAQALIEDRHRRGQWRIVVAGDAGLAPEGMEVNVSWVNHDWGGVEPFEVEPGVELLWSLTAVAGTLTMLMLPLILVYISAQARDKRMAAELAEAAAAAQPTAGGGGVDDGGGPSVEDDRDGSPDTDAAPERDEDDPA